MSMDPTRRRLLKLLSTGVIGHTLDIDRLLWVPGAKTIFLPPRKIQIVNISEIVALELERLRPRVQGLFEQDDLFFKALSGYTRAVGTANFTIPLEMRRK